MALPATLQYEGNGYAPVPQPPIIAVSTRGGLYWPAQPQEWDNRYPSAADHENIINVRGAAEREVTTLLARGCFGRNPDLYDVGLAARAGEAAEMIARELQADPTTYREIDATLARRFGELNSLGRLPRDVLFYDPADTRHGRAARARYTWGRLDMPDGSRLIQFFIFQALLSYAHIYGRKEISTPLMGHVYQIMTEVSTVRAALRPGLRGALAGLALGGSLRISTRYFAGILPEAA